MNMETCFCCHKHRKEFVELVSENNTNRKVFMCLECFNRKFNAPERSEFLRRN